MTTETPNRAGLYRKLAAIAGAIGRVEKDGYNPQLKYKYATPATVMEAVKPLLDAQKLAIVPQVSAVIKEETGSKTQSGAANVLTRVEMTYLILDGDSGESLAVPWVGEGQDWSDKGIAKAQTIALRTFLIQLFQIPSGDEETDPDASAHGSQPIRRSTVARRPEPNGNGASYEEPPTEQPAEVDLLTTVTAKEFKTTSDGMAWLKLTLSDGQTALVRGSDAEMFKEIAKGAVVKLRAVLAQHKTLGAFLDVREVRPVVRRNEEVDLPEIVSQAT